MVNYIFLTLLSITCLLIIWVCTKSESRSIGGISLIVSVLIAFGITTVAESIKEYSNLILWVSLTVLVMILVVAIIIKQHEIDVKATTGLYSVMMLIGFFIAKSCHNDDLKSLAKQEKIETEINDYKSLYDFNVDSLIYQKSQNDKIAKANLKSGYPIIIYRRLDNGKLDFDYEFNRSLDEKLKSFSLDSIQTIVILENSSMSVGRYSNDKTTAEQIITKIIFVDRETIKEINSTTIFGSTPPQSISYRRSAPSSSSGSYPSNDKILDEITRELKL